MTWAWLAFILLLIIFILAKQHADRRKGMEAILTLVPRDRFAPPIVKDVTKSWWEIIAEILKQIGKAVILIGIGWLLHGCINL